MEKHSKRYQTRDPSCRSEQGIPAQGRGRVLSKFPKAKFDETVELSFRLGVDPDAGRPDGARHHALPNGSGKKVRVLVFTDNPRPPSRPAPIRRLKEYIAKINAGWLDFDVAIATTDAMKEVRAIAASSVRRA
jgi:large subunit ribosomal protein L1